MSSLVSRVSAASQRRVLRAMSSSLNLPRQFEGARDVAILGPFVAAAEQYDNHFAAPDEIHPVAGTVIDPHLRHTAAHRLHVTGIAEREASDANRNPGARLGVPQSCKPSGKNVGLPDLRRHELSLLKDSMSRFPRTIFWRFFGRATCLCTSVARAR